VDLFITPLSRYVAELARGVSLHKPLAAEDSLCVISHNFSKVVMAAAYALAENKASAQTIILLLWHLEDRHRRLNKF